MVAHLDTLEQIERKMYKLENETHEVDSLKNLLLKKHKLNIHRSTK